MGTDFNLNRQIWARLNRTTVHKIVPRFLQNRDTPPEIVPRFRWLK